jgi:hypothetical protein
MSYVLLVRLKGRIEKTRLRQALTSQVFLGVFVCQVVAIGWALMFIANHQAYWNKMQQQE